MEGETKHWLTLFVVVVAGVIAAGFVAGYINEANSAAPSGSS
jgi:hypothetical protein